MAKSPEAIDLPWDFEDWAKKIVNIRYGLHKGKKSRRVLSPDYEFVGLAGEWAFANRYGYEVDEHPRPNGDNGRDFVCPSGVIDVKTSLYKPQYIPTMLVEEGKVKADIYVHAICEISSTFVDGPGGLNRSGRIFTVWLNGWAWSCDVLGHRPDKWPREISNHIIPDHGLRSMGDLKWWIMPMPYRSGR